MARYTGEYKEILTIDAPIDAVKRQFSDIAHIARNLPDVKSSQPIDALTLEVTLHPKSAQGITFVGRYQCRYEFTSEDLLEWRSLPGSNPVLTGSARFSATGPRQTRIEFHEKTDTEIEVNRILGAVISPIVTFEMKQGVKRYLDRVREAIMAG